jgi:hypothetical protein
MVFVLTGILALAFLNGIAAEPSGETSVVLGQDSYFGNWQLRGEYLLWWTDGNQLPALVTTSPPGTPRADAGRLGSPGVQTVFGADAIDNQLRPAGRITLRRWLEDDESLGIEGVYFHVGDDQQTGDFTAGSSGTPILARPFFNVQSGLQDSELVAYPTVLAGRVDVNSSSRINSGSLLLRQAALTGTLGSFNLIGGYRYFEIQERLSVHEQLTSTDPGGLIPLGTAFDVVDRFGAENNFHGGELGVAAEFMRDMFSLELLAKVAFGNLHSESTIQGNSTVTLPGLPPTVTSGGLLALPSNIGSYSRDRLAFLPEFGINGTILISPRMAFICGYTLILLNDVVRTGDLIDTSVNTSQLGGRPLAGAARPTFTGGNSDLWVQGVNLGFDFRW